jgi:4-hydroxy-3-methylbut-2-en-1-yl diphosphate reductase
VTAQIWAPLWVERAALRSAGAARGLRVRRTGMGPARAARAAASLARDGGPVLVAGVGGGLAAGLRAGDLVVASEVRDGSGPPVPVPSAALLAGALRRLGLRVRVGPIHSSARVVAGPERGRLAATGALAVDMESAALAAGAGGHPFAVLRSIVDTPEHPLWRPGTLARGAVGLRALRRAVPALEQWSRATGAREVLLAAPATTDRRQALRAIARESDLVLVVGSDNSSNSPRLVEVARREGVPAHLVEDATRVDLGALAGARRIGITAGASAPPHLVDELVHCLAGLGPVGVREARVTEEDIRFTLSREVG